jgi:NOPS (NUC059) domain.
LKNVHCISIHNSGIFSFELLFSSLRPVVLEPFEQLDDIDGYAEKNLPKKNPDYYKAREVSIFENVAFVS